MPNPSTTLRLVLDKESEVVETGLINLLVDHHHECTLCGQILCGQSQSTHPDPVLIYSGFLICSETIVSVDGVNHMHGLLCGLHADQILCDSGLDSGYI